jgi:hypothetical protein
VAAFIARKAHDALMLRQIPRRCRLTSLSTSHSTTTTTSIEEATTPAAATTEAAAFTVVTATTGSVKAARRTL